MVSEGWLLTNLVVPQFPVVLHQGLQNLVDFHGAEGEADVHSC